MKILITAFEPFGGEPVNPAQEAVALVPDEIAGAQIVKCTVPVVFGKAIETVCAAIDREEPDAVLCIGQAGGRFHLTPERVAINIDDARIPDNDLMGLPRILQPSRLKPWLRPFRERASRRAFPTPPEPMSATI